MKKTYLLIMPFLFFLQFSMAQNYPEAELKWKLGVQAYTFKKFTFAEALEKIKLVGSGYVEAYSTQPIGNGIEGTMHFSMSEATREKVKELLEEKGIEMVAYGVVSGEDRSSWLTLMEFARAMGIGLINAEPNLEDIDYVNELAGKYGITVALHNHPKPSIYWNPDTVLALVNGRENIKACADVGHWVRSGLDPLECLKKLEGHIVSLHFKDLNCFSENAHDVPWGTGISGVKAMLEELNRQKFEGLISVEYEYNWENSVPEITESIDYFRKTVAEF